MQGLEVDVGTLQRLRDGEVSLTVVQAELVARILRHDWSPVQGTEENTLWWQFFEIEKDPGGYIGPGNKTDSLARWVLRVIPLAKAAAAYEEAVANLEELLSGPSYVHPVGYPEAEQRVRDCMNDLSGAAYAFGRAEPGREGGVSHE